LFLSLPGTSSAGECKTIDALDSFATSGAAPPGAECSTYLTSSSETGASCYWVHSYRSATAEAQASELWDMLRDCRIGHSLSDDAQVNHPDSYDLREWANDREVYAISVKDKGAQNRTLVFIRIEPRAQKSKD